MGQVAHSLTTGLEDLARALNHLMGAFMEMKNGTTTDRVCEAHRENCPRQLLIPWVIHALMLCATGGAAIWQVPRVIGCWLSTSSKHLWDLIRCLNRLYMPVLPDASRIGEPGCKAFLSALSSGEPGELPRLKRGSRGRSGGFSFLRRS